MTPWVQVLNSLCPVPGGWASELQFHPVRRWRFDLAAPELLIAIEVEGGVFRGGRHTRGRGYVRDLEKYNAAVTRGWRMLRYTPDQMAAGAFCDDVAAVIARSMTDAADSVGDVTHRA